MNAGRYAEACAALEQSHLIWARGSVLLNLGVCHAHLGHDVLAWKELRDAERAARDRGLLEAERTATENLRLVTARLAWLRAKDGAAALRIDGIEPVLRDDEGWVPVQPGTHRIMMAAADGEREVRLVPGERRVLEVAPPPASSSASATPSAPASSSSPAGSSTPEAGPPPRARTVASPSPWPTIALVTGGAGVVIALSAGAFALHEKSVVRGACPDRACSDPGALDDASRGRTFETIADIGAIVGIVGIGTWLFFPRGETSATVAKEPGGAVVRLRGSF